MIGVITKNKSKCLVLQMVVWSDITVLEKILVKDMLMMYTNENNCQYHHIIVNMSIDYKKHIVITGIKPGMQYLICLKTWTLMQKVAEKNIRKYAGLTCPSKNRRLDERK